MALSGSVSTSGYSSSTYPSYVAVTWSATQSASGNSSVVSWSCLGGSTASSTTNYTMTGPVTVTINGTVVLSRTDRFQMKKGMVIGSGSITIPHNADGTKTVSISVQAAIWSSAVNSTYSGSFTLNTIDRTAPTVSFSYSGVTVNSVAITANASTTCDVWQYSTNGGSSWATFDSTGGTSKSYTITGLAANTAYPLRVQARKTTNQIYGTSGTQSVKTLGATVLTGVSTVTADAATVSISFTRTIYAAAFTHTLYVKNGSTTILTFSGLTGAAGTAAQTVTLTAAQRTTLLAAMSKAKSFTGTFELVTYTGSTQVGSLSSKTATIQTTANSAPTFDDAAGFTYRDFFPSLTAVTGNDQILVKGQSIVSVTASTATAKNGASISSYEITGAGLAASSTSTSLTLSYPKESGSKPFTLKVTDSRGWTRSVTKYITIADYTPIDITDYSIRRVNEVENYMEISVSGKLSTLMISGSNKNSFQALEYRYRPTNDPAAMSEWVPVDAIFTDTTFSFTSSEWISIDAEHSWYVYVRAKDKLTSEDVSMTVSPGIPLVSFRPKKIGINQKNPQAGLDVVGGLVVDGAPIIPGVKSVSLTLSEFPVTLIRYGNIVQVYMLARMNQISDMASWSARACFTLPAGYRPVLYTHWPVMTDGASSDWTKNYRWSIDSAGVVSIETRSTALSGWSALGLMGVEITPEVEKLIDGVIEAEVLNLGHSSLVVQQDTVLSEPLQAQFSVIEMKTDVAISPEPDGE